MGGDEGRGSLGREFIKESRQQLSGSAGMIRHCLDQLDDAQAWWRPRDDMNSIANLLLHLTGNLKQRFPTLIAGGPDNRDRLAEFTERNPIPKAELQARFEEAVAQADAVLAGLSDADLLSTRRFAMLAGSQDAPIQNIIYMTLVHLGGHTQEILHLTRLQLGHGYAFRHPEGVPPSMRKPTS